MITPQDSSAPPLTMQPMLTAADVAALLHTSEWAVKKMARRKQLNGAALKVSGVWLFRRNDIQRFVDGQPL